MDLHIVKARLTADGRGIVSVDGKELATTRVQIDAEVDNCPRVTVTLLCAVVEIETEAIVTTKIEEPPAP